MTTLDARAPALTGIELADHLAQESLRLLGADPADWVAPTATDHDVVVVGGGQSGVTIAYALRRAGIRRTTVLEAADEDGAGVWQTRARMRVLRTPKTRSGPELGNPALGFRAWFEAQHGSEAFDAIGRISRTDWARYLAWFRRQVGVEPRYRTRLVDLEPANGHLRLHLLLDDRDEVVETARKVVFANGVEGSGGPFVPSIFDGLPRHLFAHTADAIVFDDLAGRSVGVLGAATSAFDAAATALESGAAEVHLFSRRSELRIAPAAGNPQDVGAQESFHLQDDASRWRSRATAKRRGSNSPLETVQRAVAFPNFHVHLDAVWTGLRERSGRVVVDAGDGTYELDFVIAGTGYQYDPSTRAELRRIAPHVALWGDVYEPPPDLRSASLERTPYLGRGYELTAKDPGDAPWVSDVHLFNAAAAHSFGRPVGDIPSLQTGVPRLVTAILQDLALADAARSAESRRHVGPAAGNGATAPHDVYAHAIWPRGARS